jgi:hypothetical protein
VGCTGRLLSLPDGTGPERSDGHEPGDPRADHPGGIDGTPLAEGVRPPLPPEVALLFSLLMKEMDRQEEERARRAA